MQGRGNFQSINCPLSRPVLKLLSAIDLATVLCQSSVLYMWSKLDAAMYIRKPCKPDGRRKASAVFRHEKDCRPAGWVTFGDWSYLLQQIGKFPQMGAPILAFWVCWLCGTIEIGEWRLRSSTLEPDSARIQTGYCLIHNGYWTWLQVLGMTPMSHYRTARVADMNWVFVQSMQDSYRYKCCAIHCLVWANALTKELGLCRGSRPTALSERDLPYL